MANGEWRMSFNGDECDERKRKTKPDRRMEEPNRKRNLSMARRRRCSGVSRPRLSSFLTFCLSLDRANQSKAGRNRRSEPPASKFHRGGVFICSALCASLLNVSDRSISIYHTITTSTRSAAEISMSVTSASTSASSRFNRPRRARAF